MKLELPSVFAPGMSAYGRGADSVTVPDEEIANLVQRTEEANQALVRGDIDEYVALTQHAEDYTLMAPFGGAPTHGFDASSENRAGMARFFKSGTLDQELLATYRTDDLAVLVTVERARA